MNGGSAQIKYALGLQIFCEGSASAFYPVSLLFGLSTACVCCRFREPSAPVSMTDWQSALAWRGTSATRSFKPSKAASWLLIMR